MQYQINNKNLSQVQAAQFLDVFNENLDKFESQVHKKLAELIDQHLGH